MAIKFRQPTIGLNFPFTDNAGKGDYLDLTVIPEQEIKSNLIHLLLTRKGSRYFLPDFGTNLYQFVFDPIDDIIMGKIENEIIDACEKYLPNLKINKINITQYNTDITYVADDRKQHTLSIDIDYTISSRSFQSTDTVTITF